jgi:DNA-binding MarR family transcriptional regulator
VSLPSSNNKNQARQFDAYQARRLNGFLAVPLSAIREYGAAAQSLAAILDVLRQDGRRTFRRQESLAKNAGVNSRTFRRHVSKLESAGILSVDRKPDGNTYRLLIDPAELMADGFLPLPRYVLERPWAQRVLYAWLVYRAELSQSGAVCEDGVGRIRKALGLSKTALIESTRKLAECGLIARDVGLEGENGHFELLAPTPQAGSTFLSGGSQGTVRRGGTDLSGHLSKNFGLTKPKEDGGFCGRISKEDFDDLPALHARLVAEDAVPGSQHGELCFFALAAHAQRLGKNPQALLAHLIRHNLFHFASDADVDSGWQLRKQQRQEPRRGGLQGLASILETIRS